MQKSIWKAPGVVPPKRQVLGNTQTQTFCAVLIFPRILPRMHPTPQLPFPRSLYTTREDLGRLQVLGHCQKP